MLAELAANRGDIATVRGARARLAVTPEHARLEDDIEALYWLALWRSGKTKDLMHVLADANLGNSTSITQLSVAARILNHIPEKKESVADLLTRMKGLVRDDTPGGDVLQAAEAFLACKKYEEAVELYERVMPKGAFSELHEKLLYALIQSGNRRKAFALIKAAPAESLFSENFRHLAIELAQAANDWAELRELSELELKHNRSRVDAWLFRGIVYLNERHFDSLRTLLANAPIELKGKPRTVAGLANLDIRFGNKEKGIARLYRRLREDLGDSEAAVAYFALSATAPSPLFQESIDAVSPGTSVQLRVDGEQRRLTIDPVAAGPLPQHPDFTDSNSAIARQLLGRKVGDRVSITESFGFVREYEIASVESAYLALGRRAGELIHSSVKPVKGMLSVPIPTGEDGKPDFRHVLEQLKRNSERIKAAFETYGEGKLTLGILARAIGTTTPILVNDWPGRPSPTLYVWSGRPEEEVAARDLFKERRRPAVIDLLTVSELVFCECEAALVPLAPVLIAQSAVDTIAHMIEEAKEDQSAGNMREENGRIVLIENTNAYKARRVEILAKIQKCIDTHCRSLPVYGPEAMPNEIREIARVLDHESSDAMLLALEHQAYLTTLDGRLRELANQLGKIPGVWPQIFMAHAREQGAISSSTYFYAVFRQLCTRRTHVSLGPNDLGWLLQQGDATLQAGMRAVKEHLSDSRVDPASAFTVVAEIIERMPRSAAQLGAIGEIVEHLLAAVFSHPGLNKEAAVALAEYFVGEAVTATFAGAVRDFFEAPIALQRRETWRQYLVGAVRRAGELADQPLETIIEKRLKAQNLFCSATPRLVFTGVAETLRN
jgi:transcription elongation GreA/GreB family factor